jgi:hypothetical protein
MEGKVAIHGRKGDPCENSIVLPTNLSYDGFSGAKMVD